MTRRNILRETTVFLRFSLLTALMTWPWILHLRDAMSDRGDSYAHAYWLWWDAHQTFHDPWNLFNATIFFPYKYSLAFSENDYGIGLLFSPLYALGFRPVTVHSVATLTAFAFSGYAMFRLTRTLTGANSGAWVAGIIFAFLPYHFQRLPHLPLIFAGWIPLTLEALVLFTRQRSWKRAGWLGVAFTMNALTCLTWFVLTLVPFALSAVFLLIWCRLGRDRDFWIRGACVFVVVSLALLWFGFPYFRVHEAYGFARSAADATDLSALPIHWLVVSERNKLWSGLGARLMVDELTLFPGLLPPLLALAAFGLVRPISRTPRAAKFPLIGSWISRRLITVLLDLLAFAGILVTLLTIGYGSIHFRVFGFQLLISEPLRAFVFFLAALGVRWLIAYPEVIHRILHQRNLVRAFRSNPCSVAFALGIIWGLTGFLGSLGMHFFFHRILFEFVPFFKSIRAPVRWAMICYLGLSILAGIGAVQFVGFVGRWLPRVPRKLIYVVLAILILFEQRVAPIQFVRGEVDPDAITLRLKQTPMSGGIVELPAEKDNYAYYRYMLRAADHGRPIVTASSSFAPPIVQELESLTLTRPIPDRLIDLLESIPASYLVVHNSLLSAEHRRAIESFLMRELKAGRIRFINGFGESLAPDDLYAIVKNEPTARTEVSNRIDGADFFVRQQYLDVLKREPAPADQSNLATSIKSCKEEVTCLQDHRAAAALTVFHSREFQDAGYFLFRLYKTAFQRMPKYLEWERDIGQVNKGAEGKLTLAKELVAGKEFIDRYPERLTNLEYVRKMILNSGQTVSPAEQKAIIDGLNDGKTTRADVLIKLTANSIAAQREYKEALVAACYFDYLERDPDAGGYSFWLKTLENPASGEATVIKGFINAGEYRARFGQP
jgi:Domain of unknown function (DUF4214)